MKPRVIQVYRLDGNNWFQLSRLKISLDWSEGSLCGRRWTSSNKSVFCDEINWQKEKRISLENEISPSVSAFYNAFKAELNLSESHLRSFFWVILLRLNFMCRLFGTLCLFHLHRRCWGIYTGTGVWIKNIFLYKYPNNSNPVVLPAYTAYENGTECSETSAHKIQTPGNHPKERIQHSEHGGSLKSRMNHICPSDLRKDWSNALWRHSSLIGYLNYRFRLRTELPWQ